MKLSWHTNAVQKVSGLVLFLRLERAPRDAASCERVLACLELLELGTPAVAFLSHAIPDTLRIHERGTWVTLREEEFMKLCTKNC